MSLTRRSFFGVLFGAATAAVVAVVGVKQRIRRLQTLDEWHAANAEIWRKHDAAMRGRDELVMPRPAPVDPENDAIVYGWDADHDKWIVHSVIYGPPLT